MSKKIDKKQRLAEMLSAYLDGQVTATQRQRIEHRLAEDAESRKLLEELRDVSQIVGQLPIVEAPGDLRDRVFDRLERDMLLTQNEALSELAGKSHLRWRRLVAAAAVICLVGAIAAIVYNVLAKPFGDKRHSEPVLMVGEKPAELVTAKAESPSVPTASVKAASTPTTPIPRGRVAVMAKDSLARPEISPYGSVQLSVHADSQSAASDELEHFFADNGITRIIRYPLVDEARQYAFLCSPDQLCGMFRLLERSGTRQIDAVIVFQDGNRKIVVPNTTEEQLLALACETDPANQLAVAEQYRLANEPSVIISPVANNDLTWDELDLPADYLLLGRMRGVLAMTEPELDNLRPLANLEDQDTVAKSGEETALMSTTRPIPEQLRQVPENSDNRKTTANAQKATVNADSQAEIVAAGKREIPASFATAIDKASPDLVGVVVIIRQQ